MLTFIGHRLELTLLQYCCYQLALKWDFNLITSSHNLFKQFIVNISVKMEGPDYAYNR